MELCGIGLSQYQIPFSIGCHEGELVGHSGAIASARNQRDLA